LFERGNALADAVQGSHAQCAHALADGDPAISRVLAREMMSLRTSSLMVMASMMARRPA